MNDKPTGEQLCGTAGEIDRAAMELALVLAARGRGFVEPNPMVGAVVVGDDGRVIASGNHAKYGGLHAEAAALADAGSKARGQTLYVTLEPCAHHGKQPPCAEAVIASGVRRVVCAMGDPFPEVSGRGFAMLREAGIAVEVGLCEGEARRLNGPFLKRVSTGEPYVIAKFAMTLDGNMATRTGHSMWISGEESRAVVHAIRGVVDAIIVGGGTAAADNPKLTVRPSGARVPQRVVIDSSARYVSLESELVRTARDVPTVIFHSAAAESEAVARLADSGVVMVEAATNGAGHVDPSVVLRHLGSQGMTNVLVEGGPTLLSRFQAVDAIDEYRVFLAPKVIGAGLAARSSAGGSAGDGSALGGSGLKFIPEEANVEIVDVARTGDDVAITALVDRPWSRCQASADGVD